MTEKRGMKALELWCRRVTEGYPGVKIENMTTSWRDGLAFCALIHHFRPDLIDFDGLDKRDIYKNNELAFRIAERQLGIPALLDAEDMVEYEVPDRLSILTYLSQFYQAFVSNQQGSANSSTPRTHSSKVTEIISPTAKTPKTSKVGSGRLETCWSCRRPVFLAERLVAGGKLRHRTCFTCKRCGNQLNLVGCYETETGDFVCETCPDEEEEKRMRKKNVSDGSKGDPSLTETHISETPPNNKEREQDLDFEETLLSIRSKMKRKFLGDFTEDSNSNGGSFQDGSAFQKLDKVISDNNQQSTARIENLNHKIRCLLGGYFNETLSLLNHEPESFIADISDIIDNIITDAVKEVEGHVSEESEDRPMPKLEREEVDENQIKEETVKKEKESEEILKPEEVAIHEKTPSDEKKTNTCPKINKTETTLPEKPPAKTDDYPEDLNPFADDEEEEEKHEKVEHVKPNVTPRKGPIPAARHKASPNPGFNEAGQKIIEAPVVNLNPFWSDGEPSSDDDVTKPMPAPRTSLRPQEEDSPFSRSQYGSFTSLNSVSSSVSRKKKPPAPQPPSQNAFLQTSPRSPAYRAPSPTASIRSHRKSKPAPPPPIVSTYRTDEKEILSEKKEKNYENKLKQNLSVPDKSSYGKWKRKKGQAPGLPIPQRRRITPLPLEDFYRELEDLEIQQRELERQGVSIEQTIRMYEVEPGEDDSIGSTEGDSTAGKDVEGLVLQLFDIVNQKNELFRRQAELMYLRRQQRLEEEHADLEYQIRCLMGRSERNKTDSDKAQEEELIRRLVDVVERRNEIIECLDMDRRREVEEDKSIHHHLEVFTGKKESSSLEEAKHKVKVSPSILKFVKKRKGKREKSRGDADKDTDEGGGDKDAEDHKQSPVKSFKSKKKWFSKI